MPAIAQEKKVWEREIDCYEKVRKLNGEKNFYPYLYQGQSQSVDAETGLAYNRFRKPARSNKIK
jgi:uncharacterized protein RhaS with RHS repeats